MSYRRGHLKFQKGALQSDPVVLEAFGMHSQIGAVAESLFGAKPAVRYRGLYLIVPFEDAHLAPKYSAPHIEAHPVHIIATTYLDDVEAGGGGLHVWPGSHTTLYPQFGSKMEFTTPVDYKETVQHFRSLRPYELTGKKGDVIFIHHRLLHAPSLNTSSKIRFAMFTDYMRPDFLELAGQSPGNDPWEDWPGVPKITGRPDAQYFNGTLDPDDLKGFAAKPDHYSTQNKRDASALVRQLCAGDIWLLISDRNDLSGSCRIEPCGENLPDRCLRATSDHGDLKSTTPNDFVAKLPKDSSTIHITSDRLDLFVRLVKVNMPISSSEVLIDCRITATETTISVPMEPRRQETMTDPPRASAWTLLRNRISRLLTDDVHL